MIETFLILKSSLSAAENRVSIKLSTQNLVKARGAFKNLA